MLTRQRAVSALFLCTSCVVPMAVPAQSGGPGIPSAEMRKLRQLNMPVVAPVPKPLGLTAHVVTNAYDKSYKIVYSNLAGASITFEVTQLAGVPAPAHDATQQSAAEPPKRHGFLQHIFGGGNAAKVPTLSNADRSTGTSGETEAQGSSSLMADSQSIGPIRFTAAGPCLHGTADAAKATVRGVRVTVTGCNIENADVLISTYKRVRRV
ncbi:MAG: hypothetical protein JWO85_3333 [Candidatus Eremiobacteraeota bacterium]|nr:hypothetical protein [Candidatus Eremiobacteraeota bacterium]